MLQAPLRQSRMGRFTCRSAAGRGPASASEAAPVTFDLCYLAPPPADHYDGLW